MRDDIRDQGPHLTAPSHSDQASADAAERLAADSHIADFKYRALRLVDRIDFAGRPSYDTADLAKLALDPTITGPDADVLAALYTVSVAPREFMKVNGQPVVPPLLGSGAAIESVHYPTGRQEQSVESLQFGNNPKNFAAADTNHDKKLSRGEINSHAGFKKMVELNPEMGQFLDLNPDKGITADRISFDLWDQSNELAGKGLVNLTTEAGLRRDLTGSRSLYADSADPLKSIRVEDIHQGGAGDCYFLSVLADIARQRPELIRDAIKDNGNGTYTVTFKGDVAHPITVAAPTDTELALYNGGSKNGLWAPVMEKAFAAHQVKYANRVNSGTLDQDAVSGGFSADVIPLLTGGTAEKLQISAVTDRAAFARDIETALAAKRSVTLDLIEPTKATAGAGLSDHHSYTVVGYQRGANGGHITVRNPWGLEPGETRPAYDKGEQKISIDYLAQTAGHVTVERSAK